MSPIWLISPWRGAAVWGSFPDVLGKVVEWQELPPLDWNNPQAQMWLRVHAPAIIFGVMLVGVGIALLAWQRRGTGTTTENPREENYLRNQKRRRSQVSGMFILMGMMIPIGDCLIPWKQAPRTFALYWLIVILLAVWTGILALGDLIATRAFMNSELRQLRARMELDKLAAELKQRAGTGNGE